MMAKLPSAKEALAQMNEDYVVAKIGGKVRIVGWETRDTGAGRKVRVVTFSSVADMKTLKANRFVSVKSKDADGETVTRRRPLFTYWMEHADRPTAIGFTIDPKGGRFVGGRLNLWQGFAVEPKPGDWSLLRRHIVDVICNGNEEHAFYLLRYIAFAFQNPTIQPEVVVVLRGKQGTGKGTLMTLLCELFGAHGLQVSDRRHLIGNFNAHLMQVCFLFGDEAFWAGDKQSEGTLKRMATEPTLMFEPKGLDAYEGPNMLTVMMASNEKWVVPAGEDDRRFVVFDLLDTHKQDSDYFGAIRRELNAGGREGFLHDMLAMDLEGWHPRDDRPMTQAKAEQIAESAGPLVHWLGNILAEGALPYRVRDEAGLFRDVVHDQDPALARADPLRIHAAAHQKHLKAHAFWAFLDEHGIAKAEDKRRAAGRYRRFQPLAKARERFMELHPWWRPAFDDEQEEWRMPDEVMKEKDQWLRIDNIVAREEQEEEAVK
jgi:hypothetical protein